MNDVGLRAVLFFVRPVAGILADLCCTAAQILYQLFNWASDRLKGRNHA